MSRISYWRIMMRRKPMPSQECDDTKLGRVFGTFDLTALGISATLGVGVYVLAGHVAKIEAGPSVILSFAIAAATSLLAGLCYAEFSSRVPKSGSAYIFTYVAIGEFVAFIIGWNLLLEYIIGSASIAKGLSLYIDSLINNTMKNSFKEIAPIQIGGFLSSYFDFFAFGGPILLGLALAFGLKKSAGLNNILCCLNLGVVAYVVVVVLINANLDYWRIDPELVSIEHRNMTGNGGFFPFGFSGTLQGAATCFFGFVGFDAIATTGEEVRNPQKSVPRSILLSLLLIFLAYFGVSLLTLMWPYYLLDAEAPLPHAFNEIGWISSKWIVTIGGIIGLIASLFGAMFPLPRILYAMSLDGLIFREFGIISSKFKTPIVGTLCAAILTSCFAALFELAALVNMLSIGVLLAYTVVAISIIVLRFSQQEVSLPASQKRFVETSNLLQPGYTVTAKGYFMQLIRLNSSNIPNTISMTVVATMIICFCCASFMLSFLIIYGIDAISSGQTWALVILILLSVLLLLFSLIISIQPRQSLDTRSKPFMVPIVPFLPAISIFVNIYLMLMLDYYTWIRFAVWMLLGLLMYFACAWYYNKKSSENVAINITNHQNPIIIIEDVDENDRKSIKSIGNDENLKIESQMTLSNANEDLKSCQDENYQKEVSENSENMNDKEIKVQNDETETKQAIEILDAILEDQLEELQETEEKMSTKSIEAPEKRINLTVRSIDFYDLKLQIDKILESAAEIASKRDGNGKNLNIFQNHSFLTHLSDVLTNAQSQTMRRKKSIEKEEKLKHSSSAPDFKELDKEEVLSELLQKFAEIKLKKDQGSSSSGDENSEEEETVVDKVNFREKLEKLLSQPPTLPSTFQPIPLPRKILKVKENSTSTLDIDRKPTPRKYFPIVATTTATMQRQRQIFDEVLKNIKLGEKKEDLY